MAKLRRKRRRSIWSLVCLLAIWSSLLGWGLAQLQTVVATETPSIAQNSTELQKTGGVDPVPSQLKRGETLYQQRCGTCHVALPPQVLPSQTWQTLLPETNHYGVVLPPFQNSELRDTWEYLSFFSRPMVEDGLRPIPYRVQRSIFFKVLHPEVEFTETVTPETCIKCHPGTPELNFRQLNTSVKTSK